MVLKKQYRYFKKGYNVKEKKILKNQVYNSNKVKIRKRIITHKFLNNKYRKIIFLIFILYIFSSLK